MNESQTAGNPRRVFVYSTPPPHFIEELFRAFRRRYPDVETHHDHAPAALFLERAIKEVEEGRCPADVMMLNRQQAEVLKQRGFLQPYRSPESRSFPERCQDPDEFGTQVFMVPFSLAFHTGRVSLQELPRRYEDLLDPRWKGKLLYSDPVRSGSGVGWYSIMKGHYGEDFLRKLGGQQLICKHPAEEHLAKGEGSILITAILDHIERLKNQGAPVDWIPMPLMMVGGPHAVLFRHAKNPDEGKKWIDFLLSDEGQEIMSGYHIPNRPGVKIRDSVYSSVLKRLEGHSLTPFTAQNGGDYETDLADCIRLFKRES
ncbi:MAG: ABC transporter substrate-binding protein [Candidatus Binatia bacterium]